MSPRIIHIPLSGGDRKAQAKGIRYACRVGSQLRRQLSKGCVLLAAKIGLSEDDSRGYYLRKRHKDCLHNIGRLEDLWEF